MPATQTQLVIFIGVTAAAVVIQAIILIALFVSVRATSMRMAAMAEEFKTKVLPTVEITQSMLVDMRPKIENTVTNVNEMSTRARAQMERLDATVSDVVDRTRLQVIRADELINRTMDRVEDATETVHRNVVSPVRQASAFVHGVGAALEFLVSGKRRRNNHVNAPQDEMFI